MKNNKKFEKLGTTGVAQSLSSNRDINITGGLVTFNPSTGNVGLKSLGKIDYLVSQGYTSKAEIPEKKTKVKSVF